ncbi:purine nucleoside permease [Bisporella sp. PMI_857]|nr:purine nucleoside permease [Bisporella sp. PMI_857]
MNRQALVYGLVGASFASTITWLLRGRKTIAASSKSQAASKDGKISPKVFIITHFADEEEIWHGRDGLDLKARKIRVPGLAGQHPEIFCSADGQVCLVNTTMGLINAALSISALLSSPQFDLTKTYFLIAGVAGINPKTSTLGSVTLARYVVQVDLQYELDAREIPSDWETGYFPQGAERPTEAPTLCYGTEVFEVSQNLRDIAAKLAKKAVLKKSDSVTEYCTRFQNPTASTEPTILTVDVTASNVFFHGPLLSKSVENTVSLLTNGRADYGLTAQEDSATLAALLRGHLQGKIDFSRIIVLRAASNFDQPPDNQPIQVPIHSGHGGFELSKENIWLAGREIVNGIISEWDGKFEAGIRAENYIGDIYGSLGGNPDFTKSRFLTVDEKS